MKPFPRSVFLFSVIEFSALAAKPVASITSAEPFALDGHPVNTPGVSSFPVVVGDTVSTTRGPAVLLFSDGSAMKLGSNSAVRIAGVESRPKVVLLSGALDYKIVPGSNLSVMNLDSEHKSGNAATASVAVASTATPAPALGAFLQLHPGQVAAKLDLVAARRQQSSAIGAPSSNQNVSANYVGEDTNTVGNWKGKYGADGELIPSDVTNPPPYATVSLIGNATTALVTDTNDPRELQPSNASASARVVSTYSNNFTIDLNLTDGNLHRVSLYLADFDNAGRAETITIIDPATQTVLSTQNFSSFSSGVYESWNIKGHVQIRVVATGKGSAIVNGIFFDAPVSAAVPPDSTATSGATASPNSNPPLFENPKFIIPVAAAIAVGLTAGLLSLPPVSR